MGSSSKNSNNCAQQKIFKELRKRPSKGQIKNIISD